MFNPKKTIEMKLNKTVFMLLAALMTFVAASASDRIYHDGSMLPAPAKALLEKNFKAKVSIVKVDKDFGRVSDYEVVLTDGTEVTFDRSGNWTEIETSIDKSVPSAFVPKAMSEFVKKNHKDTKIVGLEKKGSRGGYEAVFSNGIEARFDSQGNFLRYDD